MLFLITTTGPDVIKVWCPYTKNDTLGQVYLISNFFFDSSGGGGKEPHLGDPGPQTKTIFQANYNTSVSKIRFNAGPRGLVPMYIWLHKV